MKLMGLHCLTDIHHQARSAGADAHHGDRGNKESPGIVVPSHQSSRLRSSRHAVPATGSSGRCPGMSSLTETTAETTAVRQWVKQSDIAAGRRDCLPTAEREAHQLRRDKPATARGRRDPQAGNSLLRASVAHQQCRVGWIASLLPSWLVPDPPLTRLAGPNGMT